MDVMCNWVCVDGRHVQLGLCGLTSCVAGSVWMDVMCNWVCVDGRHEQLGLCGWTSCVTGFV